MRFYWLFTTLILAAGIWSNYIRFEHWTFNFRAPVTNYALGLSIGFSKVILAVGYVLLFNGLYQVIFNRLAFGAISKVGRMALSNYILQSIICSLLFYGYGFDLYNSLTRTELWLIIPGIWMFQLVFSHVWLNNFKYGPLEWVWRKLTYSRLSTEPMKNVNNVI